MKYIVRGTIREPLLSEFKGCGRLHINLICKTMEEAEEVLLDRQRVYDDLSILTEE